MTFISPPHRAQISGSTSKTFRMRRAQQARLAGAPAEAGSGSEGGGELDGLDGASGDASSKSAFRIRFA